MKALVVGKVFFHLMPIPALLHRSGFNVDVLSTTPSMAGVKYIANNVLANDDNQLLLMANAMAKTGYRLIVIADDLTLKAIVDSNLAATEKRALLPIIGADNISHIGSKIGLSRVLKASGISTPDFVVAQPNELMDAALGLGFPILVKIDFSGAGEGVFECRDQGELRQLARRTFDYPLLVQKKIAGRMLDLSGFFQNGKLICFSHSEAMAFSNGVFSPSKLRKYRTVDLISHEIISELNQLGNGLGAHGFANISCIESESDQRRYYFEADMRPNVWLEHAKYYGDDPAPKIRNYFLTGTVAPQATGGPSHESILLPYLPRMTNFEILFNRHRCRHYFDDHTEYRLCRWLIKNRIKKSIVSTIKPRVAPGVWQCLKYIGNLWPG